MIIAREASLSATAEKSAQAWAQLCGQSDKIVVLKRELANGV